MNSSKRILNFILGFPLVAVSLGFMLGCVFQYYTNLSLAFDHRSISVTAFLLFLILRYQSSLVLRGLFIFCLFLMLGIVRASGFSSVGEDHIIHNVGSHLNSEVLVVFDSRVSDDSKTVVKLGDKSGYLLLVTSRFETFYTGEVLQVHGVIEEPPEWEIFDYSKYLEDHNIYGIVQTSEVDLVSSPSGYYGFISVIKKYIVDSLNENIHQPQASLLSGMLIGDVNGLTQDFNQDLEDTGTTHIVAVSGYNVSLILMTLLVFSRYVGKYKILYLSTIILTIFICIVGLNNLSALRAYLMGLGLIVSLLSGRKGGSLTFLLIAAAIILFINPKNFTDIGFQLSFGATLGLIIFSKMFSRYLSNLLPELVAEELAIILAANTVVLPIILYNFGKLNVFSVVINLVIAPLVPLVTISGVFIILILKMPLLIRWVLNFVVLIPVNILVLFIKQFSNFDFLIIEDLEVSSISLVIMFVFEAIIFIYLNKRNESS